MIPPAFFRTNIQQLAVASERRPRKVDLLELEIVYEPQYALRKTIVLLLWALAVSFATACGWLVWCDMVAP